MTNADNVATHRNAPVEACHRSASRMTILGVPLDLIAPAQIYDSIYEMLRSSISNQCHHIITLNPEYVMRARHDQFFAASLQRADLITADGIGVLVAARLLAGEGAVHLRRVTGVHLVERLVRESNSLAAPVFFLGATPTVAAQAAENLRKALPSCRIAGWWAEGSAERKHDAEALTRIAASGAKIVFVAYGAPGQVLWIDRNREALGASGVRLAIGIGGALDFLAGEVPRAPRFVQRIGFEWLYRLINDPRRWRRQRVLPLFALLVLRDVVRCRIRRLSKRR